MKSLRAQNQAAASPEEVAKSFMNFLAFPPARRYAQSDVYFSFNRKTMPVSQKSWNAKTSVSQVLLHLKNQMEEPHFRTYISVADAQKVRVQVERDEITHPREVVLIRENRAWKVDVIATYAAWNRLDEAHALARLQAIFGQKSDEELFKENQVFFVRAKGSVRRYLFVRK